MTHPSGIAGDAADAPDTVAALRLRVVELLSQHHVVTLACHDERGAWAAAVFYAHDGLDLLFLSSRSSRHIRSLAHDARLAGAIHGPAQDWRTILGLQVSGIVDELSGAELDAARQRYAQRFPFVGDGADADPALSAALRKSACWRLRIDEAVVVDNTRGLGSRQRWVRS